jgi:hypothetical protein
MKRALAERAKFQEEQSDGLLHHISGSSNTEIDIPGGAHGSSDDLNNASLGLGTNQSTSPFAQQQQTNMQHHKQNEQKDDHMRVEAPPRKIPRIKSSSSPRTPTATQLKTNNQTSNGARNKSSLMELKSSSLSNPKKRSLPPSGSNTPTNNSSVLTSPLQLPTVDEEEDDEQNEVTNTKFYLKHQNRALASELYKYKHAIAILEQERNVRREECKLINGAMRDIVSYWNGMEGVLLGALGNGVCFTCNVVLHLFYLK